jgi:hypothetical protein
MFYFTRHELQTDFAMVKIGKAALMVGRLEEDCANANLIAAAPDMYAALEAICRNALEIGYCHMAECNECKTMAALRKARGA